MKNNTKNIGFALILFGILSLSSCKKETVETIDTEISADSTTVITTETTAEKSEIDLRLDEAKEKASKAQEDLKAAIEKGDKKAQEAAQKAADDAESAWEKLKSDVKEGAEKTGDALDDAAEKTKESYNKVLEDAKAK